MSKNFIELINEYEIIIPLIQRDYAQGRKEETANANKFLNAIHKGLKNGLNLDFIYGETKENKFIPLDGQQRLTTLFLLHWYASLEHNYIEELVKFSYQVRSSTKDFIKELTAEKNWEKLNKTGIKKSIENSNWFFLSWKNDPTVLAILNMLDLIEKIFKGIEFDELNNITFELLKLDKFNLTDELYVKMNARGKPLTEFENFKAEFEKYIEDDITKAKLDNQWLDIFWKLGQSKVSQIKDAPKLADDMFYNFFYNITFNFYLENMGIQDSAKKRILLKCKINNEDKEFSIIDDFIKECSIFDFYKSVYSKEENIKRIILILDNLHVDEEFKTFIEKREISQWERARFYAICLGYTHNLDDKEFGRWKQVSFNLINNQLIQSPDDLIKSIKSLKKLIEKSDKNIYSYIKDDSKNINYFSAIQRDEESLKATLICENTIWEKELKQAEDNWYLNGQVGFLLDFSENNIDTFKEYRNKFNALWNFAKDNYDNQVSVYQALLTKGDYLPKQGSNYTFCSFDEKSIRIKNDNWRKVFNSNKLSSTKDNTERRLYLQYLLDDNNFDKNNIGTSLVNIIDSYPFKHDDFLSHFIKNTRNINYCKNLQVRWQNETIYLLKKWQMNGTHSELYTYSLFTEKIKGKIFKPFNEIKYNETSETLYQPSIWLFDWTYKNKNITLDIEYKDNYFHLEVSDENGKIPKKILATLQLIGFNNGGIKSNISYKDIMKEIQECCDSCNQL